MVFKENKQVAMEYVVSLLFRERAGLITLSTVVF